MTPLRGTSATGATPARRTPVPGGDGCAAAGPARRRPARRGGGDSGDAETPPCEERLTALDACILEGVAAGASTAELAAALYLSRQGVEYHIGLMLRQFQVPNRAALVSRAHSLGVLSVGTWPPRVVADFVE